MTIALYLLGYLAGVFVTLALLGTVMSGCNNAKGAHADRTGGDDYFLPILGGLLLWPLGFPLILAYRLAAQTTVKCQVCMRSVVFDYELFTRIKSVLGDKTRIHRDCTICGANLTLPIRRHPRSIQIIAAADYNRRADTVLAELRGMEEQDGL